MKITKDTYIPIGVAGTLFASILAAGLWLNGVVHRLDLSYTLIKHELADMNKKLDQSLQDRWTASDMKHWSNLLRAENKDLKVPDPVPSWRKK